jgi:hypothetical protein
MSPISTSLHPQALSVVLSKGGGEKASPASIEKVQVACLSALVEGDEESVRVAASSCLSALTTYMDSATIKYVMTHHYSSSLIFAHHISR